MKPKKKTVYLVINGPLEMSPGKIAAQSFQACQRLFDSNHNEEVQQAIDDWKRYGTKTIVKIAKTEHLFQRAVTELSGVGMIDEGMNEVEPGSLTIFATYPMSEDESRNFQTLKHKNIPIYRG